MFKTLQWNIGGGMIRTPENESNEPYYTQEGLDYISKKLYEISPDIVTLQETHTKDNYCQTELLAEALGYDYWFNDIYADSHVTEGFRLGQGVISRYPLNSHAFELFFNPKYVTEWDGSTVTSHDKGLSRCTVDVAGVDITILTLHAIPFRPFNIDPHSEEAKDVRLDMQAKLKKEATKRTLIQGDFNYNEPSFERFFPELLSSGLQEAIQQQPTAPKGKFYDHVAFQGLKLIYSHPDNTALTDHYPIVSQFDI